MKFFKSIIKIIFYFILCIGVTRNLLQCNISDPEKDKNTLAVIENRSITSEDFTERFQDLKRRVGLTDNGETRRQILKNMINEELLINEARQKDFDKDADGRFQYERIKTQELLNAYNRRFIIDKVTISDEELQSLFIRLNTKIKARHLYAPTYEKADSLYNELQKGVPFKQLAQENFEDPVLRESGGSLGYITVDEMEPPFEDAAFSLKVGEISRPVRTSDGYSIIKVDDRKVKPLLTEYEYSKHRLKLEKYWHKRKIKEAVRLHVDSLRQVLDVSFNEPTLQKLFELLHKNQNKKNPNEDNNSFQWIDKLKDESLVYTNRGNWDVETFQEFAKFTSQTQRNWIYSKENLKDYIAGLVVRSYILDKGEEAGLNKTTDYNMRVSESLENYLLKRIEESIYQEMEIPEDSLRNYYDKDPERFAASPKINLLEIVLNNKAKAALIAQKLKSGISFSDLAKKHSVLKRSAEKGGELGYLTPQDLGKWSNLAFSLNIDEWVGPVEMNSVYVFLKCIDKNPARIRRFEEAKDEVRETLQVLWWNRVRDNKIKEIRSRVRVLAFPEKLKTIRFN